MKLLLDTHVVLWWLDDPGLIAAPARAAIEDPANDAIVSSVVVWELVIKSSLGKLTIPDDLDEVIHKSGFRYLPLEAKHAWGLRSLPPHHRDPFDRMLVAQALSEQAVLVTRDRNILRYAALTLIA